jgi:hypothetical protein
MKELKSVEVAIPEGCCNVGVKVPIEGMTFGHDNYYTFEVGVTYTVPNALADHLEARGYLVWRT